MDCSPGKNHHSKPDGTNVKTVQAKNDLAEVKELTIEVQVRMGGARAPWSKRITW
jgi:hypothetical protein